MNRLVLMIIPALICGVVFIGCNPEMVEKTDFITSDDIISFNVNSSEIVFTQEKVNEILSHIDQRQELQLFIGNKPVFVPPIMIFCLEGDRYCGSPLPWAGLNDLGLIIFNSKVCLLTEGYMPSALLPDDEKKVILKKQEETSKKRKKELEVLIKHLSKAGKIVE